MQIKGFALEAAGHASRALSTPCTLTLHLPVAAQSLSPAERPMGSVVKLEVDGKPVTRDTPTQAPLQPIARPALLTVTF